MLMTPHLSLSPSSLYFKSPESTDLCVFFSLLQHQCLNHCWCQENIYLMNDILTSPLNSRMYIQLLTSQHHVNTQSMFFSISNPSLSPYLTTCFPHLFPISMYDITILQLKTKPQSQPWTNQLHSHSKNNKFKISSQSPPDYKSDLVLQNCNNFSIYLQ